MYVLCIIFSGHNILWFALTLYYTKGRRQFLHPNLGPYFGLSLKKGYILGTHHYVWVITDYRKKCGNSECCCCVLESIPKWDEGSDVPSTFLLIKEFIQTVPSVSVHVSQDLPFVSNDLDVVYSNCPQERHRSGR